MMLVLMLMMLMMMMMMLVMIIRVCLLHYLVTTTWGAPANAEASLFTSLDLSLLCILYIVHSTSTAFCALHINVMCAV